MSTLSSSPESPLPAGQAEAVLARSARIAATGMPLSSGLRAAAEAAGSYRMATALRRLAAELDRGRSLDDVLEASRLPQTLTGLLRAAQRTGHFGAVLAEWIENRRIARQHWRSIEAAMA